MFKIGSSFPGGRLKLLNFPFCRYSSRNHYAVLGITKNATIDEIKKAYYEQSKQHHPDFKHGNQEVFRAINSAYEILGNPRLRKMYDRGLIFEKSPTTEENNQDSSTESAESVGTPPLVFDPKLIQFTKEQVTVGFERDQERRTQKQMRENVRSYKSSTSGAERILWFILLVSLLAGYFTQQTLMKEKPTGQVAREK